jgi:hypothetical protein
MTDDVRQKVEDEWFARHEEELLRQARRAHEKRMKDLETRQVAGEARALRDLHYLKCPKCGHDMSVLKLEGVELDRCGTCEGLFFDKGELESLLLKRPADRRGFFRKLLGL